MKNFAIFGASACGHGVLPLVQHDEVQLGEVSAVTKSVPPGVTVVGNPARVLQKSDTAVVKSEHPALGSTPSNHPGRAEP